MHDAQPGMLARGAGARPLGALDRLRLRISIWYVATYAAILLVLGGGLFYVVAQQIGEELDRTLAGASLALAEAGRHPGVAVRVPGVALFVTDAAGRVLAPDTASAPVSRVALRALRDGVARDQLPSEKEHVLRLHARSFRTGAGEVRVAVAAADVEDLEDRYQRLITAFAIAASIALTFVAAGGVFLARKAARPVEETVARMREFMSDAAHELRTPVTVLRTELEVALERPRDGSDDGAAFERIAGHAARLSSVVDDLFTLARAESGELAVESATLFLDDIVSDSVSGFASVATARRITLRLAEFEECPVLGSTTLLRRAVGILLDNALKYTRAGGRVTASVRAAEAVVLEVSDTGIGIDPGALPRVFDRFYRSDPARSAAAGAGLGLSIALRIAELHAGTLTIASEPGRGTTASPCRARRPHRPSADRRARRDVMVPSAARVRLTA